MFMHSNHNPDVLSCLANLSSDEVFTPPDIANRMLDGLPQSLFASPDTTFLDPCTKSGVFLREIAKRLLKGLKDAIPDRQERIEHVFTKQLYGIATTELTALISRRTLYCSKTANGEHSVVKTFANADGNIIYNPTEHSWKNGKCIFCNAREENYARGEGAETYAYQFIHTDQPEEIFNMRFDVIVGNPPYQLTSGGFGAQAIPVYHKFVQQAKILGPRYLSMIMPSRWFDGGMGLDDFREEMINDRSLRTITDCPKLFDVFPGLEIKGGVCYFLRDRNYKGDCEFITSVAGEAQSKVSRDLRNGEGVILRNNDALSILEKVRAKTTDNISGRVSSINPFDFPTNYDAFKQDRFKGSVKIYLRGGIGWIHKSKVAKNADWINKYKVITPKAGDGHGRIPMKVIGTPQLTTKNSVCSMTYIVLDVFDDEQQALNFCLFMKTKLVRFLISLRKSSQNVSRDVFFFVPKLDMNREWDSKALYKHFDLNESEIAFIEEQVLEMD